MSELLFYREGDKTLRLVVMVIKTLYNLEYCVFIEKLEFLVFGTLSVKHLMQ